MSHFADGPEIKDLGGNGRLELIVPTEITGDYGAAYCVVTGPVIYAWTGDGYSDVSSEYKSYYQQQLAALQKQVEAAEAEKKQTRQEAAAPGRNCQDQAATVGENASLGPPSTPHSGVGVAMAEIGAPHLCWSAQSEAVSEPESNWSGLNCLKAEAAKIERFLGISRDAGMSDAIKWASSDNPDDRQFAADIFADIGTNQAQEYLKTLSHDPDRNVAMSGKAWLGGAKPSATYPTVKGEFIPLTPGYPPAN